MAANENKSPDFYAVLGLTKDCSDLQLKSAYKKLALRWHPDRCAAPGNSKYVEEAKKKFQSIQEAYSVLSDKNKRLMYDFGVYDSNDDDDNGMGDFLNEMAAMMSQNKSNGNVVESFEELKTLFEDMFQDDLASISSSSQGGDTASCSSSLFDAYGKSPSLPSKRNFELNSMNSEVENPSNFEAHFQGFSFGVEHVGNHREGGRAPGEYQSRRSGRKQRVSSSRDVSTGNNAGISA
ncbi:Chaperone DnaJ [Heracleum sosnowskyi]|uniref:Chaperone DnaJ n=1 Tax=Heracleum sosnowskyi TaxID=360622 RepID=A0AAD8H2J8_9APIA|nr:Chaperone DnaJ [Heracleum sosnowskyi]